MKLYQINLRLLIAIIGIIITEATFGFTTTIEAENPNPNYIILTPSKNIKNQFSSPNSIYVIKNVINLRGKLVEVSENSVLLFEGGKIINGKLVGNKTNIVGTPLIGAEISGSFQNDYLYSSWFDNATNVTIAAIKAACESNATFVIDDNRELKETLYLFGKGNLKGMKGSISFVSKPSNAACVVCGTDGKTPIPWNGTIENVVFNLTDYKYGIALCNVAHCSVKNNILNATSQPSYRSGKLLSRFNSAIYTHVTCNQEDVTFEGNVLNMHGKTDGTASWASYESISIADFTDNVRIVNNIINNSIDDLGIHSCSNVLVEGNEITTEGGRIYCADSRDVRIAKNKLGCYANSMGIMITMESQNRIGENIFIYDNIVRQLGKQKLDYGIRVNNGKNIKIFNNKIEGQLHIGYCNEYVLENLSYNPIEISEEDKIVDYVTVVDNHFTQINGNGWNRTNNTPHYVLFENNVVSGPKFWISNLPSVIVKNNKVNTDSE